MKKRAGYRWWLQDQSGGTLLLVVFSILILLGVTAFAIDFGYRHVTRNELQNIADAAALAAGRQLGSFYQTMAPENQQDYEPFSMDIDSNGNNDSIDIINAAKAVGMNNKAANTQIVIDETYLDPDSGYHDIAIGSWSSSLDPPFTEPSPASSVKKPTAVRVTVRRDTTSNSPISTFFAFILNTATMNVTATATAALTGQSTTVPGELQLPVGISDCNFLDPAKGCGTEITFSPTGTSCSAWTTFDLAPNHNPNPVILLDIVDGDLESNAYVTNLDKFDFTGGDLGNNITHLICLYRDIGYDVTADDKYICKVKTFDPLNPEYVPCDDINADGVPLNYIDDPNIPVGIGPDDPPDPNAVAVPLFEPDGDRAYYPYVDEFPDQDQTLYNKFNERPRNKHIWDTTVAVYKEPADCDSCGNPNAELEIVGFARIRVTSILGPPYDTLVGVTDCGYVDNDDSRGGGGEIFGLIGSIPGLVQ